MIDKEGYRSNVGIILCNASGQLFWARRIGQDAWQFPQGGMNENETPQDAMYRELYEEVGLEQADVELLSETSDWLHYKLPSHLVRRRIQPICIGQKQKWFLLRLASDESKINFMCGDKPEFDDWRWVDYWYPLAHVIAFKQEVYQQALAFFEPIVGGNA